MSKIERNEMTSPVPIDQLVDALANSSPWVEPDHQSDWLKYAYHQGARLILMMADRACGREWLWISRAPEEADWHRGQYCCCTYESGNREHGTSAAGSALVDINPNNHEVLNMNTAQVADDSGHHTYAEGMVLLEATVDRLSEIYSKNLPVDSEGFQLLNDQLVQALERVDGPSPQQSPAIVRGEQTHIATTPADRSKA
jgi:hypothetical protein